ncbi:MAG: Ig domain-containing protein [Dehalococcoidia bacterium]
MKKRMCLAIMVAVLVSGLSCVTTGWPVIAGLSAEADWIAPMSSLRVTCSASTPGGGDLNYEWSTSGGIITGTGPVVEWTAPEQVGMYDITVVVTNAQGRKAEESLTIVVSNGPPPTIQRLSVSARDHKYLKEVSAGYRAAKTYEYEIECIASGTNGEVVYEWSCDGGDISKMSEDWSIITWTAPNTSGNVGVTVRVFDDAGNWVGRSIIFDVVSCDSCVAW